MVPSVSEDTIDVYECGYASFLKLPYPTTPFTL